MSERKKPGRAFWLVVALVTLPLTCVLRAGMVAFECRALRVPLTA